MTKDQRVVRYLVTQRAPEPPRVVRVFVTEYDPATTVRDDPRLRREQEIANALADLVKLRWRYNHLPELGDLHAKIDDFQRRHERRLARQSKKVKA